MSRPPVLSASRVLEALRETARLQTSMADLRRALHPASDRTIYRYLRVLRSRGAISSRRGAAGLLSAAQEETVSR